jgi:hypothetical protein
VLARLTGKNGAAIDVEKLGDAFLLPFRFEKVSAGEMARLFGENFGKQLASVETGNWAGPLESNYGLHLVRVDEHAPGTAPPLANVREAVLRDLLNERRKHEMDAQYAKLRARYTIVVEPAQAPKVRRYADAPKAHIRGGPYRRWRGANSLCLKSGPAISNSATQTPRCTRSFGRCRPWARCA